MTLELVLKFDELASSEIFDNLNFLNSNTDGMLLGQPLASKTGACVLWGSIPLLSARKDFIAHVRKHMGWERKRICSHPACLRKRAMS